MILHVENSSCNKSRIKVIDKRYVTKLHKKASYVSPIANLNMIKKIWKKTAFCDFAGVNNPDAHLLLNKSRAFFRAGII